MGGKIFPGWGGGEKGKNFPTISFIFKKLIPHTLFKKGGKFKDFPKKGGKKNFEKRKKRGPKKDWEKWPRKKFFWVSFFLVLKYLGKKKINWKRNF